MTTYRLPDGIEVPRADDDGLVRGAGVWVEHPVYGTIAVERNRLTEVKPPLPPEPPAGSIVLVVSQRYGDAYMGHRNVWLHNEMLGGWVCFGDREHHISNWANVHGSGETITVLQPDQATDG